MTMRFNQYPSCSARGIVQLKKELSPEICRIVFKDNGFANDSVKTNAIQILRRNNINEVMNI